MHNFVLQVATAVLTSHTTSSILVASFTSYIHAHVYLLIALNQVLQLWLVCSYDQLRSIDVIHTYVYRPCDRRAP